MSDLTIEQTMDSAAPGRGTLRVSGPMTVPYAVELAARLRSALEVSNALLLDASGVTGVDLAGLQVLFSAHLAASGNGKVFGIIGGADGAVGAAAEAAGFSRHPAWCELMAQSCMPCERSE